MFASTTRPPPSGTTSRLSVSAAASTAVVLRRHRGRAACPLSTANARAGVDGTRVSGGCAAQGDVDAGRADAVLLVGHIVLMRTKELLGPADIGKLCGPGPLELTPPRSARAPTPRGYSLTVNFGRLKPGPSSSRRYLSDSRSGLGPEAGGRARSGAAAHQHGAARGHTRPHAVARPHLAGRRAASGGGTAPVLWPYAASPGPDRQTDRQAEGERERVLAGPPAHPPCFAFRPPQPDAALAQIV
jgi:hypothetical protein